MSKEKFKEFIKTKPELAKAVFDGKTTFQKLYETYDIYGESSDIFNQYLNNKAEPKVVNNTSFAEIANMFKNIDLDTVQKGVNGLQKAIGLVQEIVPKNNNNIPNYEERPINKYYED